MGQRQTSIGTSKGHLTSYLSMNSATLELARRFEEIEAYDSLLVLPGEITEWVACSAFLSASLTRPSIL
jgi:hypothetical protein